MNLCIFAPYNFQIPNEVTHSSGNYVSNIIQGTEVKYMPLRYNLPNKFISLYQILDYAFRELFYNDTFEGIIYTDIRCNIKDTATLQSMTQMLYEDKFVYSDNVTQPFCIGITKKMFEAMGKPSFKDFNLIWNLVGYHGFKSIHLEPTNFVMYE